MGSVLPVVLFVLAGILVGGAWSVHRQGASRGVVIGLAALAVLALGGGILWLFPDGAGR